MKCAWIHQHRDSFPIAVMCEVLAVSRSGSYDAVDREPSARAQRRERIKASVQEVHAASHGIDGSAKIAEELAENDELETACRNTVASAMRELGLKSRVTKGFTPTTTHADPTKAPAPNVFDRDFSAERPNQKWVADITYLPTLAEALRRTIETRRPVGKELLHHSDRGCQDTSDACQQTLATLGIACSMSCTGECYDNAVAERFFWSLKHERTKNETFVDLEAARLSVFKYVETFLQSCQTPSSVGLHKPRQVRSRTRPGRCGVNSTPVAVRKSWATAPACRRHDDRRLCGGQRSGRPRGDRSVRTNQRVAVRQGSRLVGSGAVPHRRCRGRGRSMPSATPSPPRAVATDRKFTWVCSDRDGLSSTTTEEGHSPIGCGAIFVALAEGVETHIGEALPFMAQPPLVDAES
ncbi:MAG: DDE-type integrase/transposase/recombinase [Pirellulales bacterium]|nr:DDE-type integrase/transposase/recombinase [Pirellulales bacterium]